MKAVIVAAVLSCLVGSARANELARRVQADSQGQRPLVVHVVVALCDNANQGIVPVPRLLGNGRDPAHNLYWGARFGVRTYFNQSSGWRAIKLPGSPRAGVLERVAFRSRITPKSLFVVAEAWDGARIREAITAFLEMAAGRQVESIDIEGQSVQAGGGSHVLAFVGHNGLMDFQPPAVAAGSASPARAAIVLACASTPYFEGLLNRVQAYPLLLTTGLMAPEAYSLEAAVRSWFKSTDPIATRQAAADSYSKYQRCSRKAALRLFAGEK